MKVRNILICSLLFVLLLGTIGWAQPAALNMASDNSIPPGLEDRIPPGLQFADTIIINGQILTMDEENPTAEAIAIGRDGRILAAGSMVSMMKHTRPWTKVIDAEGSVVSPGFIDIHSHFERILNREEFLVAENYLRQGVTTVLSGNCGSAPFPLSEHLPEVESRGTAINYATLLGQATMMRQVMEDPTAPPTDEEMEDKKALVAQEMKAGAWGISTGLEYYPGLASTTEEVAALSEVAGEYGGIYASHIRSEAEKLVESIEEAIEIGQLANIPVQISHIKSEGYINWPKTDIVIQLIEEARARGEDVTADVYPYTAFSTSTAVMIPAWAYETYNGYEGMDAVLARLEDEEKRALIKEFIVNRFIYDFPPDAFIIRAFAPQPEYEGKSIAEILEMLDRPVTDDEAAELLIEIIQERGAGIIVHAMSEENVREYMQQPWAFIGSDGGPQLLDVGRPHPRNYGSFPRVLGKYVREEGVLSLEQALQKMTSLPAEKIGFSERGSIKPGYWADVVIFNPDEVVDHATFIEPHQYPSGIEYVFVNGMPVLWEGEFIAHEFEAEDRPGMVLYGPGYER